MKVTAIITNHNYGDYITRAVNSLTNQTRRPDKIVIVDDFSFDSSLEIYKSIIDDVKVFRLDQNVGPSIARNIGIRETITDTDIFVFLDADDAYCCKESIGLMLRKIECVPRVGLVYSDEEIDDVMRGVRWKHYKEPFSIENHLKGDIIGGNYMITAEALKTVGLFDEEMRVGENYDLTVRVARKFLPIHVAEELVTRTITERALSRSTPIKEWETNKAKTHAKAQT